MFSALGSKHHGIYSVLWTLPSKNTGTYAVFHARVARQNCKLQCFGRRRAPKKWQTSIKKCPKYTFEQQAPFLPHVGQSVLNADPAEAR
jgi:hypothetical protein